MSPGLYQTLIDRCWRRSGTLLYRPNQKNMCCPHYTLRLDSSSFHATRDQRQAANRFNRYVAGDAYTREAARLRPRSREEAKRRETVFDLVERVHEAETDQLPPLPPRAAASSAKAHASTEPTLPAHRFDVTLEPDTFTEEKYLLFENYQRIVHKEPPSRITRQGFASFLCNSPIRRESKTLPGGKTRELGSFHQCYRLDGRLVAIGVLDLLPHCVSAVYFLYHESIHQHNPGKLGALREIALAREQDYRWWYSGYYIHSCPKMRYKIDYAPQYVLDPETYAWDLVDKEALALFDKKPYVSLSRERAAAAGSAGREEAEPAAVEETPTETLAETSAKEAQAAKEASDDDDDDDDEEDGHPLLTSNMPGLPSMEVMKALDLDDVPIYTNIHPTMFPVKYLVVWGKGTVEDGTSFKCKVAELLAAMGPDLVSHLCLDFRHHKKPEY